MTATLDRPPRPGPDETIGPRERRRLEQARRSRRWVAAVAGAVLAVVVAVAAVIAVGARSPGPPPPLVPPSAETGQAPVDDPAPPADAPDAPADAADTPPDAADAPADERVRVQLLNGVGRPGVADTVEERLPEDEFRVVVVDNAPEFGVRRTRLLVYDDDPASLAVAGRLRDVLGAGTISVSRQPQSVVDVTVIIGRDVDGNP